MSANLTDSFKSTLHTEDLALMSAVCRELSWLEARVQMPMLAADPEALCRWLLAGVSTHGMLPEAKALRRQERQSRWDKMARGVTGTEWTTGGLSGAMSMIRHVLFPFAHLGAAPSPGGFEESLGVGEAIAIQAVVALVCVGALGGARVDGLPIWSAIAQGAPDASMAWLIVGGCVGVFAATRLAMWMFFTQDQRARFQAKAATPLAARLWRRWAAKMARAKNASSSRKSFGDIQAALRRASLGQEASQAELREEAAAAELMLLRAESVKEARQPGRQLAIDEAGELAQIAQRGAPRAAQGVRL